MSEILRKWINTRLGIVLDYNLLSFGHIVKDGTLLAELLCHYGIINSNCLENITKTDDPNIAYENLSYLNPSLKLLGIDYSDKKLRSLASGDGETAVKLFYQLYLILNNKNKLHFALNQSWNETELRPERMFNAESEKEIDSALYKWHKNKYLDLLDRCENIRINYLKHFEKKLKETKSIKPMKEKFKYDFRNVPPEMPQQTIQFDVKCTPNETEAKRYVENLKEKNRKTKLNQKLHTYMHKTLLNDLLNKFTEKQDLEHKQFITTKLLKQSAYEKQIATQLLEIQNRKCQIIENRKRENELLQKKREQDFIEQLYRRDHNVSLAQLRNETERKRILELHRRLYDEKRRRKYEKHCRICKQICSDLIDLAIKTSEYKSNYEVEVPKNLWKNWMALFCAEQPLCEDFEPIEDLLYDEECEDETLTLEIYKQNAMDEADFNDYLNLEWPWHQDQITEMYAQLFEKMQLGLNVLGYVVHKLLVAKYPLPPVPSAPELPSITTASCIVGIVDDSVLNIIENILKKKNIILIRMQHVINYCLNAFRNETRKDVDVKIDEETKKTLKRKGKKKRKKPKKEMKPKKGKKSKSSKRSEKTIPAIGFVPKETQTPRLFPGEEIQLTPEAELGKLGYEALNLGLEINNRLLTHMLVQYLRSLKDIDGWILINYPEKVPDAIALELALTGREISSEGPEEIESDENEEEEEEYQRDEVYTTPIDEHILNRLSKLLTKPECIEVTVKNTSYLTSFIKLTKKSITCEEEEEEEEEQVNSIEKFYTTLGCNNSMIYTKLEAETIQDVVTRIVKDEIFAREAYNEVINETLIKARQREQESAQKSVELKDKKKRKGKKGKGKKGGSKKSSKESKGSKKKNKNAEKGSKKGKKRGDKKSTESKRSKKSKKSKEDKTEAAEQVPVIVVEEIIEIPALPGELRWNYTDLPQSKEFQTILATNWENIEEIYMNDFKQLLFLLRVNQNSITPYVHETETHMINFIQRPDNTQEYLHRFQDTYNDLENDLREDDEFKAELHCRVMEFRTKLWNYSNQKLNEAEEERIRIVNDDWFTNHAIELVNIFVSMFQLEMDRCFNSYQLLQDYYTTMITEEPFGNKFTKMELNQFESNEKCVSFVANAFSNIKTTTENDPFTSFLEHCFNSGINIVNNWCTNALGTVKKIHSVNVKDEKKTKKKRKQETIPKHEKINYEPLAQEWQCGIEGELIRTKLRLNLIRTKAIHDLSELLSSGENLFHEINHRLSDRYHDEVKSVQDICDIFAKAIEACQGIQTRLILKDGKLQIDKYNLMYDDAFEELEKREKELVQKGFFTIKQLLKLVDIFFDLAPYGSLPTKSFLFLLQDMVAHNSEENERLLPEYWNYLKPSDISELVLHIYGNVEYVNWKDFIIYNLELPFPTEMELLETRRQFRVLDPDSLQTVNRIQFNTVQFWFENSVGIQKILWKLFQIKINPDLLNYATLLLSFCKNHDWIVGLAKALELCLGKFVCWNEETGRNYKEICRYQKFLMEQEKLEAESIRSEPEHQIVTTPVEIRTPDLEEICDESLMEEEYTFPSLFTPSICYFLKFEAILIIMTASLPWHCRTQCIEDGSLRAHLQIIYDSLRDEEFDNKVFAHEFLNNPALNNYLKDNYKFLIRSPVGFIKNIIEICTCEHYSDL